MDILKKQIFFNLLIVLLFTAVIGLNAALSDDTTLSLELTGGSLDVVASTTATFTGATFSFSGQNSSNNDLGDLNVSDTRGSSAGWSVDITGADWTGGSGMDYDGDGSATGQLSLDIPTTGDVNYNSNGDDTTGFTMGTDDSFDSGTATINFVTVTSSNGSGDYWFDNFQASQYIPANQEATTYSLTLTITAS